MGTQGAFGFRIDGVDKLSYNHFDSYPDGLGREVVEQVKAVLATTKLNEMIENVRGLRLVNPSDDPTDEDREKYGVLSDSGVSTGADWYSLLRNAQGRVDLLLDGTLDVMTNGNSFVVDSLFCEYAYILDLDTAADRFCLEFYTGFNKDPEAPGRYAQLRDGDYCGVALAAEIPLDRLHTVPADELVVELELASDARYPDDEG